MISKIKEKKYLIDGEFLANLMIDQDKNLSQKRIEFLSFLDVLDNSNGYFYNTNYLNEINSVFRDSVSTPITLSDGKKIEGAKPIYFPFINNMLSDGVSYQKMPESFGTMIDLEKLPQGISSNFEALFFSHNNKEANGDNSYNQDAIKLSKENLKLNFSYKDILSTKFLSILGDRIWQRADYFSYEFLYHLLGPSKNYYIYDMHLFGYNSKFAFDRKKIDMKEFRILAKMFTFYTDWIEYVVQKNEIDLPNVYFIGASNNGKKWYSYDQMKKFRDSFIDKLIWFQDKIDHPSIDFLIKLYNEKKINFIFMSSVDKKGMHSNAILNDYAMSHWDNRQALFTYNFKPSKVFKEQLNDNSVEWGKEFERDNLFFRPDGEIILKFNMKSDQEIFTKSFFKENAIYKRYFDKLNKIIDKNLNKYPIKGF